jgi:hypothetical protein
MEIIPFQKGLPSFTEEVTLDGIVYTFEFSWNSRGGFWSMNILNRDQTQLVMGVRLVMFYGLIRKFVDRGLPNGELYVLDPSGNTDEIQQNDFETRLTLCYFDEDEIESF